MHCAVCDSNRVLTWSGRRYFVTFIDDYSKFCYTYLLKSKDEVLDWFKVYKAEAENQLEKNIKNLKIWSWGEYTSNDMTKFCEEYEIIYEVTTPYIPQSINVAERKKRTQMDIMNCMLTFGEKLSFLPASFPIGFPKRLRCYSLWTLKRENF